MPAVRRRAIISASPTTSQPRILLIEPSSAALQHLLPALCRECGSTALRETAAASAAKAAAAPGPGATRHVGCCCTIVGSLREVHQVDLQAFDLVLCSSTLPDGFGLDALAFILGVRPELPFILMGEACDNALAAEAIRAGALDYVITSHEQLAALSLAVEKCLAHQRIKQENQRLHRELTRFVGELADKNLQLQMMINQLETMARTDELTGLCNRRWLNQMLDRCWAEAVRNDRPLAFLMMDLDEFKRLNDEGGHQRGDALLKLTGRVIVANCRQVDIPARYGGDEFCVLMPQTEAHEAVRVADRILREFESAVHGAFPEGLRAGMSIGVAHVDLSRPINAEQLVSHADEAMYAAKSGRLTALTPSHRIMLRSAHGPQAVAERPASGAGLVWPHKAGAQIRSAAARSALG